MKIISNLGLLLPPCHPEGSANPYRPTTFCQVGKVLKEGGKRGVEIEGAADMGGLQSGLPGDGLGGSGKWLKIR